MGDRKDFSQLARVLVEHMAGEAEEQDVVENQHVIAGRKGGQARAKALPEAKRAAIAAQGEHARWARP